MAEADDTRGMAAEGDDGDREGADEWVAPDVEPHPQKQGPKQMPGPNDEEDKAVRVQADIEATFKEPPYEEITPESLDANLEEKVVELPSLMTAASLLPEEDDPLAEIPVEPPDPDTPPDDTVPPFIIERNKWGPGAHGMYVRDGRSIGNWLDQEHHGLDGEEVRHLLLDMGLEPQLAHWFGKQRTGRIEVNEALGQHPLIRQGAADEAALQAQKQAVQEAFLKAQRAKK